MKVIIHVYNTQHVEPAVTATVFGDACSTLRLNSGYDISLGKFLDFSMKHQLFTVV